MTKIKISRLRLNQGAGLLVAAMIALTVATQWPQHDPGTTPATSAGHLVEPADPPAGPVEIVDVETPVTWADQKIPPVRITVRNNASGSVTARLWWLLAAPAETKPWANPAASGTARDVLLSPGETRTVSIAGPDRVPTGAWTLSLWAHTDDSDSPSRPSHGVSVTPTVHVLPTHPDVYRLTLPGRHAALEVIEPIGRLVGLDTESGPDALVSVATTTSQPVRVQLRCYISPPGTAEPWTDRDAFGSQVSSLHVEPGAPQTMECRFGDLPRRGTWQLSGFLHLAGIDSARAHEDGLYARRPITIHPDS